MPNRTDGDRIAELKELLAEIEYSLWQLSDRVTSEPPDVALALELPAALLYSTTIEQLVMGGLTSIRRSHDAIVKAAMAHA